MKDPNENKPGYKQTKIGWIPTEWDSKPLGMIGTFSKGKGIPNREKKEAGYPCLTYGDIYTRYDVTMNKFYSFINKESAKRSRRIYRGSILFAVSGETLDDIGKCVAYEDDREAYAGGDIIILVPKEVDSVYLSYFLNSNHLIGYRRKLGQGHSVVHIYSSGLKTLHVSLPSLYEQRKIVEILSTWGEAIEQTGKLIDTKKRRKKALMQQLLTDKKHLAKFSAPWTDHKLGDLLDERRETDNGDLPLLAITRARGVISADEVERKDSSSIDKTRYKRIMPGDIGYNTMRMWQGVSGLSSLKGIVSPAYTICTPKDGVHAPFVAYYFKFHPIVHLFWRYSQGLVSDTLNLKFHNFAQITIPMPEEAEQRAIAAVLRTADKEITQLEAKLKALEKQKRGLMQKLLTGTIRVKG